MFYSKNLVGFSCMNFIEICRMETKHCQLFTGDFITYGFKLYSHLKCKHFGDLVVIFEIAGDKVENIIRRAKKLALSNIVEYGLVRCRTSKINFNKAAKS